PAPSHRRGAGLYAYASIWLYYAYRSSPPHANPLLSRLRYWIASLTWHDSSEPAPARSAMVRAILRMRWYARADSASRVIAVRNSASAPSDTRQNVRMSRA